MKKILESSPLNFALIWIFIYCAAQSAANPVSAWIGISLSANALFSLILSVFLLFWLHKHRMMDFFGLGRPSAGGKALLYYLPLLLLSTSNLWYGFSMNLTGPALFCHVVLMISVGFLEELLFRGFLFQALAKDSLKTAVLVSSLTFGLGHILNLFNGRGMALGENLLQILCAIGLGLLFVMIYLRSGSLIPCILSHSTINILSAFVNRQAITPAKQLLHLGLEFLILIVYLFYLFKYPETEK